jgi:hypothetical protein
MDVIKKLDQFAQSKPGGCIWHLGAKFLLKTEFSLV